MNFSGNASKIGELTHDFNTTLATAVSSAAILTQVRTLVQCRIAPFVVLLGICANSLNIVILSKQSMRSSTSVYLVALAAYDNLYLLASALNNIGNCALNLPQFSITRPISNVFSNTAVLIICTFSCERYIAVSYPIKGRVWCTVQRAAAITGAVGVVGALLTVPDFLPESAQKQLDAAIRYSLMNTIVFTYVPIVFLVFCNALLVRSVYQASRLRHKMQQSVAERHREHRSSKQLNGDSAALIADNNRARKANNEQSKLTVMLIVVVIVFVVCQLPQAILHLIKRYYDAHNIKVSDTSNVLRRIAGNFSNLLVQINAASNFVLYSMFSTRFRATFRTTFCKCVRSRRNKEKKDGNTTVDCNGISMHMHVHRCSPNGGSGTPTESRRYARATSNRITIYESKLAESESGRTPSHHGNQITLSNGSLSENCV